MMLMSPMALSQGMRDSVFQIQEVAVTSGQIFKKEDAGQKVTEVDTTVLQEKMSQSLSALLSENTPVFIKTEGRGALASASFRGTAASHTRVSWNGININSPMTGMVDFSMIPVYIVDELNLQHGASSIAGQSGGLGGSVNLGNAVDWTNRFGLRYMQGVGSYHTYDEFLDVGFGSSDIQARTRIYHNYSKNDFTFINRGIANLDPETGMIVNPTDTNERADYTKYGLLQEVYWRASEEDILSVKYWGQSGDRTIPRATSYEGPDNSNLNNQTDDSHKLVADWKHYRDGSNILLRVGYAGKKMGYEQQNYVPGSGLKAAVFSQSQTHKYLNHLEYNLNGGTDWSLKGSVDYNIEDVASEDTVAQTGYEQERHQLSAFVSVGKAVGERMNLNAMFRQEIIDGEVAPVVPFLGFDYRLIKNRNLILKGSVARNYHHPSLNDLYWQPGGNPELLPEKGITGELGLEYQLRAGQHYWNNEATLYYSDINDWIIWLPSYKGFWTPMNIRNVVAQGVEVSSKVNGRLGRLGYHFQTFYAYSSSVNNGDTQVWGDESHGKQLVYVPLHSFNFLARLSYNRLSFSWQHNSYSERYTTSSNDVTRRDRLYSYYMNDLILRKDFNLFNMGFSARFKVNNLFDETYHSVLYRPMPGRNYQFLLTFKI